MRRSFQHDAFLCYNSTERPEVEPLVRRLIDAGVEIFYDRWHLIPGQPWQEGLETALRASRTYLVIVGTRGLGPWQTEEMRVALDLRVREDPRRVIPVLLPDASEENIPDFLRRLTWVDFRSGLDEDATFHRLLAGIQGVAPGVPIAGAPPEAERAPSKAPEGGSAADSGALSLWQEKLHFLLEQEAIASDPAQKFALRKQIEEASRKIQELSG